MSTTVRDIDISLDWLVSRSRTKRADEIGFRFLANCREINVSPLRYVYIRTKTSPLVTLYVEGLFTILCSQCRAPLSRKPNMNFFCFLFFPSWWMDVWAPTSICLILPKGFPKDRSCLSVGIEAFVYPYVYDTCGRLDCKLSSSVPLIIPMFRSIRFCWNVWIVLFCFLSLYFHFVWSPCACEISKNLPRKIGLRVRNTCENT